MCLLKSVADPLRVRVRVVVGSTIGIHLSFVVPSSTRTKLAFKPVAFSHEGPL